MTIANKNDSAENAIKTELEQVYAMATYLDAEQGRLEIVKHLVSAAIDEMESVIGERPGRRSKPVRLGSVTRIKRSAAQK